MLQNKEKFWYKPNYPEIVEYLACVNSTKKRLEIKGYHNDSRKTLKLKILLEQYKCFFKSSQKIL